MSKKKIENKVPAMQNLAKNGPSSGSRFFKKFANFMEARLPISVATKIIFLFNIIFGLLTMGCGPTTGGTYTAQPCTGGGSICTAGDKVY